jgi:cyclase
MLSSRIIPVLLLDGEGLVKTKEFSSSKYIGDPLNAVRIFNEKESDELVLLDINASVLKKEPNFALIERIANECRMPFAYGGGIKTFEQAGKILSLGVEKVILSSLFFENTNQINKMIKTFGNQSVVLCLDIKKNLFIREYQVFINRGRKDSGVSVEKAIEIAQNLGFGELILNFIDRDGLMKGMDIESCLNWKRLCNIPITVLGGIGSLDDVKSVIDSLGVVGVGCGSLFVYKGKHNAVLINYPDISIKNKLLGIV